MAAVAFLIVGFAPGVFWLWLIYQRDRYLPSPVSLIVRTFFLGMAVAFPVAIIEGALTGFGRIDHEANPTLISIAYVAFVVAGFTEELGKFFVVRKSLYRSPYFSEPIDGLIFASAAALGFASLENVVYMLEFGWGVILVRGPFSTLAHVIFGALWGYALGRQKQRNGAGWFVTVLALTGAMALHGLFDFFLFAGDAHVWWSFLVFFLGLAMTVYLFRRAERVSAQMRHITKPLARCPNCGSHKPLNMHQCSTCGNPLHTHMTAHTELFCGLCHEPIKEAYHYCPMCGSRIDRKSKYATISTPGVFTR